MNQRQRYTEDPLTAYRIASQYRALGMRTGLDEFVELSKLFVTLAWRYERYADELTVKEPVPIIRETIQEKKTMHPISRLITVFLILLLVLSMSVTVAQESTDEPTPTPEVTAAPTVEVTPAPEQPPVQQPGFDLREFLLGVVTGGATVLAGVFGVIGRLKNDKPALDAIEWLGKSIPVEALDKLNELGRNMRDTGDVLVTVTDKQPNVITPQG